MNGKQWRVSNLAFCNHLSSCYEIFYAKNQIDIQSGSIFERSAIPVIKHSVCERFKFHRRRFRPSLFWMLMEKYEAFKTTISECNSQHHNAPVLSGMDTCLMMKHIWQILSLSLLCFCPFHGYYLEACRCSQNPCEIQIRTTNVCFGQKTKNKTRGIKRERNAFQ